MFFWPLDGSKLKIFVNIILFGIESFVLTYFERISGHYSRKIYSWKSGNFDFQPHFLTTRRRQIKILTISAF